MISKSEIYKYLSDKNYNINVFEIVESTNDTAKKEAGSGCCEKTVFIAEGQTKGRGKPGRKFCSEKGSGVYMSVVFRPRINPASVHLITSFAAVAVADAISDIAGCKVGIKWVNDIYINGKKVCGILSESAVRAGSKYPEYVVLGIGINVSNRAFPKNLSEIAGSIKTETGIEVPKNLIIARILDNLSNIEEELSQKKFLSQYRSKSVLIGKTVRVTDNGNQYDAVAVDIDDNASLIIQVGNIQKVLSAGEEVSVKIV